MPTRFQKYPATHREFNRAIFAAAILGGFSVLLFIYSQWDGDVRLTAGSQPQARPTQNASESDVGQSSSPATAASKPAPAVYHLSEAGILLGKDDVPVPPADSIMGYVDLITFDRSDTFISGWAVDTARKQPASRVLVVVNGTPAISVEPSKSRPDVSAALKDVWAEPSGFLAAVQLPAGKTPSRTVIRVFAFDADGKARELTYPPTYPFSRH